VWLRLGARATEGGTSGYDSARGIGGGGATGSARGEGTTAMARPAEDGCGCGEARHRGEQLAWQQWRRAALGHGLDHGGGEWIEKDGRKMDRDERLRRGGSAFNAMTGRAGRLTGRDRAASGQSPVSSWRDRTRPVRADRMLTESVRRSPGELNTLDRTRW
jgi:hypothetical protein